MSGIDLHTHSQCSDGTLPPAALVAEACRAGLQAIALTDHDTLDGLAAALEAGRACGVEVIPGVEISCELAGREAHIVGLFITATPRLAERLARLRHSRQSRMQRMVDKLRNLGVTISLSDLKVPPGASCGRPHLAEALVAKGVVRNIAEAFQRFIGDGGVAYVAKERLAVACLLYTS
ncbi:MAG: PHP domain-containing protein, partial [Planctomycetota bacterium]|nr:PHP domain-containing protein [Planctomycetota bacterium]